MKTMNFKTQYDGKTIEKLIGDKYLMINHFMFGQDEGLPVHKSNSNVYMIIVNGTLTITLDQVETTHMSGQILTIPYGIEMHVRNENKDILEMFVLKAPHPDQYGL